MEQFRYDPNEHKAYFNGKLIPSITQLVDIEMPLSTNIDKETLKKASERGTKIHDDIERYCGGYIDEPITQEGKNYKNLVEKFDLEIVDNEITMLFRNEKNEIIAYGHADGIWKAKSYIYFNTKGELKVEREPNFNGGEKIIVSKGDYVLYDNKTTCEFYTIKTELQCNLYSISDTLKEKGIEIKHLFGVWLRDEKAQLRPLCLNKEKAKLDFSRLLKEWEEFNR